MIYFSDKELDDLLLEDIYRGDLTTQALNIAAVPARMIFKRKNAGVVAGIDVAEKLLAKLGIAYNVHIRDGAQAQAGETLISAEASADKLHQAWKVVQLVLEWSCGVAQYTAEMVNRAKAVNPCAVIACTRKSIPNTRKLATAAVLAGGGHIHRQGVSETLLVFTNHRRLLAQPDDYRALVQQLRLSAPENKVTLEADNLAQFKTMLAAQPDIIQLDKFSVTDVQEAVRVVNAAQSPVVLSVAGGVNKHNIEHYAALGIHLFITSAPYYAMPEDIKVIITPKE
ncbi:ModD protein [Necropsobacter massiliensis]|uniref:ModD protein n=1 Tax=Necropsobacter massiliensis TaxID=1400001 RepID=UPI000595D443|nr:ModD protein [Necropsobacter massiliensis]